MRKRDVVLAAIDHRAPPYVPWQMGFTKDAAEKLMAHFKVSALTYIAQPLSAASEYGKQLHRYREWLLSGQLRCHMGSIYRQRYRDGEELRSIQAFPERV